MKPRPTTAKPLLDRVAGGPVDGIVGEADPFEGVKSALEDPGFRRGDHLHAT